MEAITTKCNNLELVEALLDAGASVNLRDQVAINFVVIFFLKYWVSSSYSHCFFIRAVPIPWWLLVLRTEIMKLLNIYYILVLMLRQQTRFVILLFLPIIHYLMLDSQEGGTALFAACVAVGCADLVQLVLDYDAAVNIRDNVCIFFFFFWLSFSD